MWHTTASPRPRRPQLQSGTLLEGQTWHAAGTGGEAMAEALLEWRKHVQLIGGQEGVAALWP